MSTVLVLGASVSQVAAIRKARGLGLRVVAVDGDASAVGFADADVAEVVDFSDVPSVIDVARRHGVDGVVAISTDRAVPVAAAVAEALDLPGIGSEVARAMTDKGVMRHRLAEAAVPQPSFALVGPGDDLGAALASVGAPAVIKPVDSGGQRGLFMIETEEQLRESLPITLRHSRAGRAILERYVQGSELNVIAVVSDGKPQVLTLSDRLRPPGPGFGVGWAHLFPSLLPRAVLEHATSVACEAIVALGLREGIAFPQLLAAGEDVLVVEVAARIAAGQMADLVRLGTGVDLVEIALARALGRPAAGDRVEPAFTRPIAIRFLTARPGPLPVGRLESIDGLDRVREAPGVLEADLYLQLGETINAVQVDADRRGYIIATGADPEDALARADQAARLLKVEVEPVAARRPWSRRLRASLTRGSGPRGGRRDPTRLMSTAFAVALLAATVAAFVVAESAKTAVSPIFGTRIDKVFSPVCAPGVCRKRVADIVFRVRKRERLQVWMEHSGTRVSTIVSGRTYPRGAVHLTFDGIGADGSRLPDGSYEPVVQIGGRTITLPNEIRLVTTPPRIVKAPRDLNVHISPDGDHRMDAVFVHYALDEPAHGVLLVDGRQVELTRRQTLRGVLTWNGRLGLRLQPPGRYSLAIAAQDAAGNRSRPLAIGTVTIRYVELRRARIAVRPHGRFSARVVTDAARVSWRFAGRHGTIARRILRLRAPKRRGDYRLSVTSHRHTASEVVVVR